jgi:hypothetical protein
VWGKNNSGILRREINYPTGGDVIVVSDDEALPDTGKLAAKEGLLFRRPALKRSSTTFISA